MEMIAHSYISDSTPERIFDNIEGFPNEPNFTKGREVRRGRKSTKGRSFGGIHKASSTSRQGGGKTNKTRTKGQRSTKGRGKKSSSRL